MTKRLKTGWIIALSVIGVIIIAVSAVLIYAFTDKDYGYGKKQNVAEFYSSWQTAVKDDAAITNIVIPGSHDAGSNGMMPLAKTQAHSVADMLKAGVRYFDLRVTDKGNDLVIFHSIIKGQKFSVVLNEINQFITANPSEFLVLDFQHLGDSVHQKTIAAIENGLNIENAAKKSEFSRFETTTAGAVRAAGVNYFIVWTDANDTNDIEWLYPRGQHLSSPYDSDKHKSKNSDNLIAHFQTYYDSYDGKGFFVLQAQRTAPFVLDKPSALEFEFKPKVNAFIDGLAQSPNLDKTNIIMRDFIASDMANVNKILKLNLDKNLIKADHLDTFTAAVSG